MSNNPFLSETYKTLWLKYFGKNKQSQKFEVIADLEFLKQFALPLYSNIGKNNTNGITYTLNTTASDFKKKVFLIYDVPTTMPNSKIPEQSALKCKKAKQYKGFISNLKSYETYEDYLKNRISAKGRSKLRNYSNRLERDYAVKVITYWGTIDFVDYKNLMHSFRKLLIGRFDELNLDNDIIHNWAFYEALVYPMIVEKRALLNVVYVNESVGAISLAFIEDKKVIGAVKTFDIKYRSYNIGTIELMNLIKWSFDNEFSQFDFSKGDQDYKSRFSDAAYHFECHVLYDSKSIKATLLTVSLSTYFNLKQYLREIGVNTFFSRLKHRFKLS